MATTRSELQGFKELDRVLRAMPGRLAERELTSAVRAGRSAPPAFRPAATPTTGLGRRGVISGQFR